MLKSNLDTTPRIFASRLETIEGSGGGGESGATFTPIPTVPESNILHLEWTNNKSLPNPTPVDIVAPRGLQGIQGIQGEQGYTPIKGVDYFTIEDKAEIETNVKADLTPLIPTKNSQLLNDSGYETTINVDAKLQDKVDIVVGKQLSTNDYTNLEKVKLKGLENSMTQVRAEIIELDSKIGTIDTILDIINRAVI